jgi:cytochrome c
LVPILMDVILSVISVEGSRESTMPSLAAVIALLVVLLGLIPAHAQLRGHGGPVRALAISRDGRTAVSGSFDTSAILWSLQRNAAEQVLRFHDGAVNAVAILADGRIATGGADARIAIWQLGGQRPQNVLEGHNAPVVGLAVSPDGNTLASASWDGTLRLWPLGGGPARILEGHRQNVNGVAFAPGGNALVSAGYDATLRVWPLSGAASPIVTTLPAPLNAAAAAPDGEIVTAGADGNVYFLSAAGELRGRVEAADTPVIALAMSPDGVTVAAASIRGSVAIIARAGRTVAHTLVGPGLPVWSVAFLPDNRTLLTGGADRMIRRWDAATGEPIGNVVAAGPADPLAAYAGDPGAEVFRACVACHTLKPDEGNRAGPSLAGLMGRRIATLRGYNFSPALRELDIVWTPETVSRLFELGPSTFTPGTKMPEQTIGSAEDRAALVRFLEKATK